MSRLFDPAIAADLQYFTLPMEVVGFALALIEVRFPATAERLARWLAKLAEPMARLRTGAAAVDASAERYLEDSLGALLSRVLGVGLLLVAAWFVVTSIARIMAGDADLGWAVGQAIAFLVTAVVATITLVIVSIIFYFSVTAGSDFIQRFVAGRAIGTLGILIAGVGVLGECYQFITQLATAN